MLWPWPLTFDLEHLQCIACDTMKLCTKFERNRVICNRVIAISIFDLMTLNAVQRVALGSESLTFGNYSVYDANTLCHAVTLTFDPLILKVQGTSSVTWSKSVQNPNFVLFDPPGKIRGLMGEISISIVEALPMMEPSVYIWWTSAVPLLSTVDW